MQEFLLAKPGFIAQMLDVDPEFPPVTINSVTATLFDSVGVAVTGMTGVEATFSPATATHTVSLLLAWTSPTPLGNYRVEWTVNYLGGGSEIFETFVAVVAVLSARNTTIYPVEADLANLITSLGVLNPKTRGSAFALMNLDVKAEAAWQAWETETGFNPYLKRAGVTRYFDPPGPRQSGWNNQVTNNSGGGRTLTLDQGLLALTSLTAGVTIDNPTGTLLTLDQDYMLQPYNALADGEPYRYIEFHYTPYGSARSIKAIGDWGEVSTLKALHWDAILRYGLVLCFQELALQISRGLFSVKDLNSEIRYAGRKSALELEMTEWRNTFLREAQRVSSIGL